MFSIGSSFYSSQVKHLIVYRRVAPSFPPVHRGADGGTLFGHDDLPNLDAPGPESAGAGQQVFPLLR
jgi:hypothetical protein